MWIYSRYTVYVTEVYIYTPPFADCMHYDMQYISVWLPSPISWCGFVTFQADQIEPKWHIVHSSVSTVEQELFGVVGVWYALNLNR